MSRHFWTANITVRLPFGASEPARTALLQAAGVPLDSSGEAAWGFLHERGPCKFGADSICRWFDTGSAASLPVMTEPERMCAAGAQRT